MYSVTSSSKSRSTSSKSGSKTSDNGKAVQRKADSQRTDGLSQLISTSSPSKTLSISNNGNGSASTSLSNLVQNSPIQPKLTVGKVDSPLEREADGMAKKVMSIPEPTVQRASSGMEDEGEPQAKLLRQEEEEEAQAKLRCQEDKEEAQTQVQRQEEEEGTQAKLPRQDEEKEVQPQQANQALVGEPLNPRFEQNLKQSKTGGEPLPIV